MNNLVDLNNWINEVKLLTITDENIDIFNKFIKFSPEKFADKIGIDRSYLVKEFDIHKKEIHKKVIIFNKVKQLSNRELKPFNFRYNNIDHKTIFCICIKYIEVKSTKFYPTITYLYCFLEETIVVFSDNQKVYMLETEFLQHFIDMREHKINSILTTLS